jgi:hypothetical protein
MPYLYDNSPASFRDGNKKVLIINRECHFDSVGCHGHPAKYVDLQQHTRKVRLQPNLTRITQWIS